MHAFNFFFLKHMYTLQDNFMLLRGKIRNKQYQDIFTPFFLSSERSLYISNKKILLTSSTLNNSTVAAFFPFFQHVTVIMTGGLTSIVDSFNHQVAHGRHKARRWWAVDATRERQEEPTLSTAPQVVPHPARRAKPTHQNHAQREN